MALVEDLRIRHLYEFWYCLDKHQIHSCIEFTSDIESYCISEIEELIKEESLKCIRGGITIWQSSAGYIGQSCIRYFNENNKGD